MHGIFSFIISIFAIIGDSAVNIMPLCKKEILVLLLKFEIYFTCIFSITSILINFINIHTKSIKKNKNIKFLGSNKKSFILLTIIIFASYIPYLLNYFPGNVLIDSVVQILQGQGALELTNHHPLLHTMIITACINIGKQLFNSYQIGAFIYTLIQTVITSLVFSFSIYYMAKKCVPLWIRVFSILFYMFCPTISFYTITMYKDIPFSLSILLLTIGIIELVTNTSEFLKSKTKIISLMIIIALCMFFRNNGVYVIILLIIPLIVCLRRYYKKILVIFLIPIIFYEIITGPIYSLLNIKQGSSREALSIPLQQFARLMVYEKDSLTEVQKNKIQLYLPIENFGETYDPVFSDPVKSHFSEEGFEQDKFGFIKLYFELACKYPLDTIESFIQGSYGYYYPNVVGWGIYTGVSTDEFHGNEEYAFEQNSIVEIEILDEINNFVNTRNVLIISMFISIGFLFWILLFFITIIIYKKEYRKIVAFFPVLFVWLTALASPVFCESRYVYSIFTCLPLLLGILTFKTIQSNNKDKNV